MEEQPVIRNNPVSLAGILILLSISIFSFSANAAGEITVVDSLSGNPLPRVSVFDRTGKMIGYADDSGHMPSVEKHYFPLTLRSLGYIDMILTAMQDSVIPMHRTSYALPEVTVKTGKRPILHIIGFAREISTLTTYSDTITLYREKWVDFMLPVGKKSRYKGWTSPRILKSKSYYRFTNSGGLDSVSDRSDHHFSWSDWLSLPQRTSLPDIIAGQRDGCDSIMGRYSPAEVWSRTGDDVTVDVDVLADTITRRWIPRLSSFFRQDLEFDRVILNYSFSEVDTFAVRPQNLDHMSAYIESEGRGHGMFRFNRRDEPFFVTTYTDINIIDREYMTTGNAKRIEKNPAEALDLALVPLSAELQSKDEAIAQLIDRVNSINHDAIRLAIIPDKRVGNFKIAQPMTRKEKILSTLKSIFIP